MELDGAENFIVGHEMDFSTTLFGTSNHLQRGHFNAVLYFGLTVNDAAAAEIQLVFLAIASNSQPKPF